MEEKVQKTDDEWLKVLTPLQFEVTRRKGTEPPFSGLLNKFYEDGIYRCVACGAPLFSPQNKYDSGSGWPSFWAALDEGNIATSVDHSHGMLRTEVRCGRCDAHLGHLFDDGPKPSGLRYCINSASLDFQRAEKEV